MQIGKMEHHWVANASSFKTIYTTNTPSHFYCRVPERGRWKIGLEQIIIPNRIKANINVAHICMDTVQMATYSHTNIPQNAVKTLLLSNKSKVNEKFERVTYVDMNCTDLDVITISIRDDKGALIDVNNDIHLLFHLVPV